MEMEENKIDYKTFIKQENSEENMDDQHHTLTFDNLVKCENANSQREHVDNNDKDMTMKLKALIKLEVIKEETINDDIKVNPHVEQNETYVNNENIKMKEQDELEEQAEIDQIKTSQLGVRKGTVSGMIFFYVFGCHTTDILNSPVDWIGLWVYLFRLN